MNDGVKLNEAGASLPSDALSGAMEKLMAHPELISMVASALKGTDNASVPKEATKAEKDVAAFNDEETRAEVSKGADLTASLLPMLSRLSSMKSSSDGTPHSALLCALKPYVSPARREAIDYVLKISQMSSLIGGLK